MQRAAAVTAHARRTSLAAKAKDRDGLLVRSDLFAACVSPSAVLGLAGPRSKKDRKSKGQSISGL